MTTESRTSPRVRFSEAMREIKKLLPALEDLRDQYEFAADEEESELRRDGYQETADDLDETLYDLQTVLERRISFPKLP